VHDGVAAEALNPDVPGSERRDASRFVPGPPDRVKRALLEGSEQGRLAVPTYIMLSTLTPEGVQTVKTNPSRIREVNREVEQLGATVTAQWATLGRFDFINVVEAPDDKTMSRVSLELGSRGTARYETLIAIPVDEFIGTL
jgi:uncharacterized protein with GYD domain